MSKRAHNSKYQSAIWYRGKLFTCASEIYRYGHPDSTVSLATFRTRFGKLAAKGLINDLNIEEAMTLDPKSYHAKHGTRKTIIKIDGKEVCLQTFYENNQDIAAVTYPNFRLRCTHLGDRDSISLSLAMDALMFDKRKWHLWHGGGRYREFTYSGELYPELKGRKFRSISAFLDEINRHDEINLVWSRINYGWTLDRALSIPPAHKSCRTGSIYKIFRLKNGQIYIGLTKNSVDTRWNFHIWNAAKGAKSQLAIAIREDGVNGFEITTLETGIPMENLAMRESYWAEFFDAFGEHGLNKAPTGGLGSPRGHRIIINGEEFSSKKEAAYVISKRNGIAPYVVLSRLNSGKPIPEASDVRTHSKHPDAGSNLFRRWLGLLKRHPKNVTESWMQNYDSFKADVSPVPEKMELVRINKELPWGKGNTEWVSNQEKMERNHGKPVTYEGRQFPTLAAAAKAHGISTYLLKKNNKPKIIKIAQTKKINQEKPCLSKNFLPQSNSILHLVQVLTNRFRTFQLWIEVISIQAN